MLVGFLTLAARDCILSRFQLHNYAGETLRERIVNVSRHPISFFQDGGLPALLSNRLVRERLR